MSTLFGKTAEQEPERFEALGNALGVVETVHAHDQRVSREAPSDLGGVRLDLGLRGLPGKFLEVDADGERANYRAPSLQTDLRMRRAGLDNSFRKQALQTGHEICAVVIALETDHVEFQQGLQNG